MSELEKLIATPSDINEHLSVMFSYAKECEHITEFGVRDIVSAWAWLTAKPKTIRLYDIKRPPESRKNDYLQYAKENNVDVKFIESNTLHVNIEPTELLFIDTEHTYNQLIQELTIHANKVSKYIILHDTEGFKYRGCDNLNSYTDKNGNPYEGLWPAVLDFLAVNPEWFIVEQFDNCFGLTILKRRDLSEQI